MGLSGSVDYYYGRHSGVGSGVLQGIEQTIDYCAAKGQAKLYNPISKNGMICQGGYVGDVQETPEKGLPEAPSPTPQAGRPANKPPQRGDIADPSMT